MYKMRLFTFYTIKFTGESTWENAWTLLWISEIYFYATLINFLNSQADTFMWNTCSVHMEMREHMSDISWDI